MKKLLRTLFVIVACVMALSVFALAACNVKGGEEDNTVAVTEVKLDKSSVTLYVGDEETLEATVKPDDATDKSVVWSVTPEGVVTVDNGKVKAVAEGTATVKATAGGKSAECAVKVNAPTNEVTAQQWESALNGETSFTIDISTDYMGSATFKIDGLKLSIQSSDEFSMVVSKEGENYFQYIYEDSVWTRYSIGEENYNYSTGIKSKMLSCFRGDYSEFTYADKKYSCASLDKTDTMSGVFDDVEISFLNGKVINAKFTYTETRLRAQQYEIKEIGSTKIDLPDDYKDCSLVNKTYVYYDVTVDSDEIGEDVIAEYKDDYKGAVITFGRGTVTITKSNGQILQTGTYNTETEMVGIDITDMTIDGVPQDIGKGISLFGLAYGEEFVLEKWTPQGNIRVVFKLQTA